MDSTCLSLRLYSVAILVVAGGCSGGGDSPGPTGPPAATAGSLRVNVVTTGVEIDTDGYTVVVGSTTRSLGINGDITIADLTAGNHTVTLEGVSANCSTPTTPARTVAVVGGQTSLLSYQVFCTRKPILFVSDRSGANQVYRMNEDGQG
ncbi:MAG: hypothetical protein M3R07_04920, partial [Gemmatimonadota bacterium]|nr:hypothetical protein [Gemmatimonadota bacterium]